MPSIFVGVKAHVCTYMRKQIYMSVFYMDETSYDVTNPSKQQSVCFFVCFFFFFFFNSIKLFFNCLNLGFSGHATIALVLWIHCFHLHVLTSDVVSLLPFLDSISLIIIVVQCRV